MKSDSKIPVNHEPKVNVLLSIYNPNLEWLEMQILSLSEQVHVEVVPRRRERLRLRREYAVAFARFIRVEPCPECATGHGFQRRRIRQRAIGVRGVGVGHVQ